MIGTHQLKSENGYIIALGVRNYFSWIITLCCNEWTLSTIYGNQVNTSNSFRKILDYIGYDKNFIHRRDR